MLQPYSMQEMTRRPPPYVQSLHLAVEAITGSSSVISRSVQNLLNRTLILAAQKISASFLQNINYIFNNCPLTQDRKNRHTSHPGLTEISPFVTHVT